MADFIDNRSVRLRDALKKHLSESIEALFALAFIRQSGVNMIVSDLVNLIQRGGKVSILFANDFGATEAEAIISLQEIGVRLRYFSKPNASFHLKTYIFKKANIDAAIIGSSNLSASGLTTGTEWSVCVKPNEIDFSAILSEFNQLWESEHARPVTAELVYRLESQTHSEQSRKTIQEEDRYPIPEPNLDVRRLINDPLNYVVRRRPDNNPNWFFQVMKGELNRHSANGPFNVIAVCNYQTPNQLVFSIPYAYLKDNILPFAHLETNGRYLFNINKKSFKFNWNRNVKMDGQKFLLKEGDR